MVLNNEDMAKDVKEFTKKYTLNTLKAVCKEHDLRHSGGKETLVQRLLEKKINIKQTVGKLFLILKVFGFVT